jgi:hypothetical protein
MSAAEFLYPLIPRPISVTSAGISGRLFVDGNIESNRVLFRFRFDGGFAPVPLFVKLNIAGKTCRVFCGVRDFTNPDMKSGVLKPEFSLADRIEFAGIELIIGLVR